MSQLLWQNPVLLRELDERVRNRRTAFMLTVWLFVLSGIVLFVYSVEVTSRSSFEFGSNVFQAARVGQNIFDWLLFFMIVLVLFLVPGFTAASIAGERERQTLLPMQVTLLRPIDIIIGKVAASIVFTLLLIVSTMPVLAFVWLVGGVTLGEVFAAMAMTAFSALVIACITVACSAVLRRVPGAIVAAYGLVMAMVIGSLIVWAVLGAVDESRGFDNVNPPSIVLAVNPFFGVADVSDTWSADRWPETPMAAAREAVWRSDSFSMAQPGMVAGDVVMIEGPDGMPIPVPFPEPGPRELPPERFDPRVQPEGVPFWVQYVLVCSTLALLALAVATRRVRTPAKAER